MSLQVPPLGSHIRIHTKSDRLSVILTTVIKGQDLAWITYSSKQLDELIRLLQKHRNQLT